MTSITAWGIKLTPGKPYEFKLFGDPDESDYEDEGMVLRLTNAALTDTLADPEGRTTVKLVMRKPSFDNGEDDEEDDDEKKNEQDEEAKQEFVLCSLTPGKIEQVQLDINVASELVSIELVGKNEVHLMGNIIDQKVDNPPFGDSDDDSFLDDGEGAYRLDEVSSDVEINPDEVEFDSDDSDDADRFEELDDEKPVSKVSVAEKKDKNKDKKEGKKDKKQDAKPESKVNGITTTASKRSADAMDEDTAGPEDGSKPLSKKAQKKLAKKLKTESGDAVAPPSSTASSPAKPDSKEGGGAKPKSGPVKTTTLPSGVKLEDSKIGTGKQAKKGNTLSMRYIGKLEDGKTFDKNVKGEPFKFRLGAGEVIKGWDEGLVGMQVGGERVLTVPSELGYGKKGSKPEIPPNATLRFEVKLLEIK